MTQQNYTLSLRITPNTQAITTCADKHPMRVTSLNYGHNNVDGQTLDAWGQHLDDNIPCKAKQLPPEYKQLYDGLKHADNHIQDLINILS